MVREERFLGLDALRGVAAFCVAAFHYRALFSETGIIMHSFLAVDFFFLLSGFVLAHAYERQLLASLSWRGFMVRRLKRLMPLVVLGVLAGAAYVAIRGHFEPDRLSSLQLLAAIAFGVALLPVPPITPGEYYPLDGPTWSLFFLGLALFRWRAHPTLRWVPPLHPLAGSVLLLLVFLPPQTWPGAYNFLVTAFVLPPILLATSRYQPAGATAAISALGGRISYPLYILHSPIYLAGVGGLKYLHRFDGTPHPLFGASLVCFAVAIAALAAHFYDAPIRRLLPRWSGKQSETI